MSSKWRESTWGDEISLEYGKGIRGYKDADGPVPVFGTNGQVGWTEEPLADGPGIILGRKGAYRGTHYSEKPFFVIDTAYYLKPKSHLNMRWLYYSVIHHRLGSIDDGSPIPSTTRAAVYVRKFNIPDDETQHAIAKILGDLDDKIQLLRDMNRTLEDVARAVFRAWFVDFEPVRAKAAGATSFPGVSQDLFDTLPDSFGPSEIGEIPTGWTVGELGSLVAMRNERIKAGPETEALPYVPIDCIDARSIWLMQEKLGIEAQSSLVRIRPNDILFGAMRPYFHKVCLSPFEATTRTTVFVLTPRSSNDLAFCLMVLSEDKTIEFATSSSIGSTIPYAKWDGVLERYQTVLPPANMRKEFGTTINGLLAQGASTKSAVDTLADLRDTLLAKLISGELEAPSLEALGLAGGE